MSQTNVRTITIQATVNAPIAKIWQYWTEPEHIINWNNVSDDWHTPRAENDVRTGGRFNIRMEAKDGSAGFDFEGTYDNVELHKRIEYTISDGRKVNTTFESSDKDTKIVTIFEAETENSIDVQREGWQTILNNFSKYTESN